MREKLKIYQPIINPALWGLPRIRADILHALGKKRVVREEYELSRYYEWIKISPKVLYRLQSEDKVFTINKDDISLSITDWKFIAIGDDYGREEKLEVLIKSCIENPIKLNNPDSKPSFHEHIKYNWKDYFFLSFLNPAINNRWQETFVLVSYNWEWLKAQQIWHIQFATNTEIKLNNIDEVPTLFVKHEEPDSVDEYWTPKYNNWEYQFVESFDLKNQERKIEKKYQEYENRI